MPENESEIGSLPPPESANLGDTPKTGEKGGIFPLDGLKNEERSLSCFFRSGLGKFKEELRRNLTKKKTAPKEKIFSERTESENKEEKTAPPEQSQEKQDSI